MSSKIILSALRRRVSTTGVDTVVRGAMKHFQEVRLRATTSLRSHFVSTCELRRTRLPDGYTGVYIGDTQGPKTMRALRFFLDFHPPTHTREFLEAPIDGQIFWQDLRMLTRLPYETGIIEGGRNLFFSTGTFQGVGAGNPRVAARLMRARYKLHVHHIHCLDEPTSLPSVVDAHVTFMTNPCAVDILVHEKGIILFRKPNFRDQPVTLEEAAWSIYKYGRSKGINLFDDLPDDLSRGLIDFNELSVLEKKGFLSAFVRDTEMIVRDVPWSDEKGIAAIMDIINLRTQCIPPLYKGSGWA
jgi:hypothetical protein